MIFCMRYFTAACFALALVFFAQPSEAMEKVQPLALDGGAKGLLLSDATLPMVTLQLSFEQAGGSSDPAAKQGRAYLASRLLLEGAGDYNGQAFHRLMEAKAIHLNPHLSQDSFSVSVRSLSEHLPEALRLVTLMLTQPRFADDARAREQKQILAERKEAMQDAGWYAQRTWSKLAYGTHPYAQETEGTEISIPALERRDLVKWQQQVLARENLRIAVVGDVTAAQLMPLLQPLLQALPAKAVLPEVTEADITPALAANPQPVLVTRDVPQTVVLFGLPALKRNAPDYYAAHLMNYILGGGTLTSRLSHAIREKKGLSYSASSSLMPQRYSSRLMGSFATRNAQVDEAVQELQRVLANLAKNGVTQQELDNAKSYVMGSFPLEVDTQGSRAAYLSIMLSYQLGDDYLEKRNGYFSAVTLEQVNRLIRQWIHSKPLLVAAGKPTKPLHWLSDDDSTLHTK
jgi:zinc protease